MNKRLLYAFLYVLSMGGMYWVCHQPPQPPAKAPTFEKLYAKPWPKTWDC